MFGVGPAEVLVLVLLGGGVGLPLGVPPLEPDATIVRAAPDECLLYVYSAGMAEPDAKSTNQTEQLLAETEVQDFLGQMRQQIVGAIQQAGDRDPQAGPVVKFGLPIAGLLLTRPTAFYVSHLGIVPGGPPDIRAALVVHCGQQSAAAKKWIAELEELAAKQGAPVDQIKDVKVGGVALRHITASDSLEADWGFQGDYFLLAIGQGAAKELIDRIGSPAVKPAAWLVDLQKQAGIERLSTLGYLNVAQALEIALPLIPDPQARSVIDALGLTGVKVVASASGMDKQGLIDRTLVNLDGAPQGLFELVSDKPLAPADLKSIPRQATFGLAARLSLATVYRRVLEQVGKVEPRAVAHFEANLNGAEQTLGFQVEKDLLASLGDVWTIYATAAEGASPWTGLVATLAVRDRAKLVDIQERLVNLVKMQGGGPGGPPFTIRQTKLQDTPVYHIVPKGLVPVAPAWCILEDRLVVAATLQTLKTHLASGAKSPSLADVPEVAAKMQSDSAPSLVMYQDTKAALRGVYAAVQAYSPLATGFIAQQGINFDMPALPSLESLDPHISPLVAVARRTKQGLLFERRQTLPLIGGNDAAVGGVAVALLLPAVQAAREAARRTQSMNNMKQIALAMHNYNDVHKHFPAAAAYADKAGKPLLSWRVAILPYIEEQVLYKQFHLDEPWDSEHNRALIDKMPSIYVNPSAGDLGEGKTVYVVPAGENTMFADKEGIGVGKIRDGLSNTIMGLEVDAKHAVPWTKPEDLTIDPKNPLIGLQGARAGGNFMAIFADGSVHAFSDSIDPKTLRALFTPAGGEPAVVPGN